jgi:hypothetical protein
VSPFNLFTRRKAKAASPQAAPRFRPWAERLEAREMPAVMIPTPPQVVTTTPLAAGDTATIGFWHNKNGQALIDSLGGRASSPALASWLSTTFPDLYGSLNLKTNADVAALFEQDFSVTGMKTQAQILAGALAVYVTDAGLAGTVAAQYGFNVSVPGTGTATYNVGSDGAAVGLANNTSYTVMALLEQADADVANGTFSANAFNDIFSGINQGGDIN